MWKLPETFSNPVGENLVEHPDRDFTFLTHSPYGVGQWSMSHILTLLSLLSEPLETAEFIPFCRFAEGRAWFSTQVVLKVF